MKSIVGFAHMQVGDMRVDFRRRDISVAQKCLHRTRISAMLHQVRTKAVTQSVRRDVRHAGGRGMSLNDGPGGLPAQRTATVQK